jgi:hypothetical protein
MNARSPFVPAGAVANTVHRRGELCWGAGGFGEAARRLASVTAGHSVAPQITHSAGRRVSVDVPDEPLVLIEASSARPTPAWTIAAA